MSEVPYIGPERRTDTVSRHEWDGMTSWVRDIDVTLQDHTKAEVRMEERIGQIEKDVKDINANVATILDLVSRAKGVWGFLGWVAGAIAALVAVLAWARDHVK